MRKRKWRNTEIVRNKWVWWAGVRVERRKAEKLD